MSEKDTRNPELETRLSGRKGGSAVGTEAPIYDAPTAPPDTRGTVNIRRAVGAGVAGGLVLSLGVLIARVMGLEVNLEQMLGSLIGIPPGTSAAITGFFLHLILCGALGVAYGWGFEKVARRSGVAPGMAFGLAHALIAGTLLGIVPVFHPYVPESLPAHGLFMANRGAEGVVLFFALHLLFGAIIGALYGPTRGEPYSPSRARPSR